MVSLRRIDANSFEETLKKKGKVVQVNLVVIAADRRTGNVTSEDKLQGTTVKYAMVKQ